MIDSVRVRTLIFSLAASFLFWHGAGKTTQAEDVTLRRSFAFEPGGRVTLLNTHGNIRIRSWDQNRIQLVAKKKGGSKEDMELVPIEIESGKDELHITSLFPEYAPSLDVQVDYQLRVPAEVDLQLVSTIKGEIEVNDVSGRAILKTDHGGIRVKRFSGILGAESLAYGEIEVELSRLEPSHRINLENINGTISLRLPKEVDAFWIVRTMNGSIESEIPFEIRNNFGPQVVHHPNRSGEPLIRAYSVKGDVHIEQK